MPFCRMETNEDGVDLAGDPLRTHCEIWVGGQPIPMVQAIELKKAANISATIAWRQATFKNNIRSLLSYERPIKENYDMWLVEDSK